MDYHFVSVAEFAEMIDHDELLEYAVVYGDYKGIPKQQVREALASGKDVICGSTCRARPPFASRSRARCSSSWSPSPWTSSSGACASGRAIRPTRLKMRIATARQEMKRVAEFDYVVVNHRDRLDDTVDTILAIISAEKHRVHRPPVTL